MFGTNVAVGVALILTAVAIAVLFGLWHAIATRRLARDARQAPPETLADPAGPTAIRIRGAGKVKLTNNSFSGFQRDVDAENVDQFVANRNVHSADRSRQFVNVTADALVDLFKDRTQVEAQALVKRYIGMWIAVEAVVSDVRADPRFGTMVFLRTPSHALVTFWVRGDEERRAQILRTGELIVATGTIREVAANSLGLDRVEF